jgi:hypothetical protein
MSLATMTNNIFRFCPGLHPDLVKSNLQDSYRYLCLKEWNRLKLQRQIVTVAPYSTGTVAVAIDGIVTGVGTTFTSVMVGRFMKVYYDDTIFEIQTYSSPTNVTLKDWSGAVLTAGKSYSIIKTIYTMDITFARIFDIIYQIPLKKKSQAYFNKIDPGRTSSASSPTGWALAGVNSSGMIQVEIYPPPSSMVNPRVYGKMGFSTLADGDSPRLPEDLIEAHALLNCYQIKDLKEPDGGWGKKVGMQNEIYQRLLDDYLEDDFQLGEYSDRVKDVMGEVGFPLDDNFRCEHDVD